MLNQFAKINPIVTNNGYLLEQDTDGNYTVRSTVRLKENEIGICVDDKSFIMNFKGEAIKITGGLFNTLTEARAYAILNTLNSHDGEIITIKDTPTKLYVLIGTNLYDITENNIKNITVGLNTENPTTQITNSSIITAVGSLISGRYIIDSIDITMGINYSFIIAATQVEGGLPVPDDEYDYAILQVRGATSGVENIFITDGFKNNTTSIKLNKEFAGPLTIKLIAANINNNSYAAGNDITNYDGNTIMLNIAYTPIN